MEPYYLLALGFLKSRKVYPSGIHRYIIAKCFHGISFNESATGTNDRYYIATFSR